jgi:hypothetical protein
VVAVRKRVAVGRQGADDPAVGQTYPPWMRQRSMVDEHLPYHLGGSAAAFLHRRMKSCSVHARQPGTASIPLRIIIA